MQVASCFCSDNYFTVIEGHFMVLLPTPTVPFLCFNSTIMSTPPLMGTRVIETRMPCRTASIDVEI